MVGEHHIKAKQKLAWNYYFLDILAFFDYTHNQSKTSYSTNFIRKAFCSLNRKMCDRFCSEIENLQIRKGIKCVIVSAEPKVIQKKEDWRKRSNN